MRGSSVHFKRISSALHAVSHASREVPPEYLLPADVSMGTHVVIDDHGQVQKALDHKMHLASRQAKATKGYSPLWEGVINLPDPADATPQQQIEIVKKWCAAYEKMTGHKVLRADVHLDEGYIDADGQPHFNAHAHVMCDRTDEKGKVKKLTSTVLREVQSMTAEVTTLQRGIDSRKTGRKHIGHQNFRFDAEKNRLDVEKPKADLARLQTLSKKWSDADLEKIKVLEAKLDGEPARLAAALAAQKAKLDEQYRLDREALKASGEATQADYQQLKKAHEKALDELTASQEQADKVPGLVADLATAQTEAAKVPDLVEKLKASQEQATTAKAQADKLAADLKTAQQEADKVPGLVEKYTTLRTKALAIQEQRNDLAKKVDTMTQENQSLQKENQRLAERREAASRLTLQTLKADFGVDIGPAEKLKGEALEKWREAAEDKVFEQQLAEMKPPAPAKRPVEAPNRPVEAPKPSKAPSPSPIHEKTLAERLAASLAAMLEWLRGVGGVQDPVEPSQRVTAHVGPVLHIDELHCIQKTGRRYAVHRLDDLDAVPALDDSATSIQYRDGKGHVSGKTSRGVER